MTATVPQGGPCGARLGPSLRGSRSAGAQDTLLSNASQVRVPTAKNRLKMPSNREGPARPAKPASQQVRRSARTRAQAAQRVRVSPPLARRAPSAPSPRAAPASFPTRPGGSPRPPALSTPRARTQPLPASAVHRCRHSSERPRAGAARPGRNRPLGSRRPDADPENPGQCRNLRADPGIALPVVAAAGAARRLGVGDRAEGPTAPPAPASADSEDGSSHGAWPVREAPATVRPGRSRPDGGDARPAGRPAPRFGGSGFAVESGDWRGRGRRWDDGGGWRGRRWVARRRPWMAVSEGANAGGAEGRLGPKALQKPSIPAFRCITRRANLSPPPSPPSSPPLPPSPPPPPLCGS